VGSAAATTVTLARAVDDLVLTGSGVTLGQGDGGGSVLIRAGAGGFDLAVARAGVLPTPGSVGGFGAGTGATAGAGATTAAGQPIGLNAPFGFSVLAQATGSGSAMTVSARDDVVMQAAGTLSLRSGGGTQAGRDAVLLAGQALTIAAAVQAGDDLVAIARNGAVTANAALTATGRAATLDAADAPLTDLLGAAVADPTAAGSPPVVLLAGSNLVVGARGGVTLSGGASGATVGDVRIASGGDLQIGAGGLTAGRDLTLLAGGAVSSVGGLGAGDDLSVVARGGSVQLGAISARGGASSEGDDGATLRDLANLAVTDPSVAGGGTITGLAGQNITIASGAADSAASITIGAADAARDVRLSSAGGITTARVNADRDVTLLAGAGVTAGDALIAGDDLAIVARGGPVQVQALTTRGVADGEASGAQALATLSGGTVLDVSRSDGGAIGALAGSLLVVSASGAVTIASIDAAIDARVATAQGLTLAGPGSAGRDLSLLAGLGITAGTLRAGDDLSVVARGGAAALGALTARGGPDNDTADTAPLRDPGGLVVSDPGYSGGTIMGLAGRNVTVAAAGAISTEAIAAERDVRLSGGATIDVGGAATAGRDLTLLARTRIGTVDMSAGDDLSVVSQTGAVRLGALVARGGTDSDADDRTALASPGGVAVTDPGFGSGTIVGLGGANITVAAATGAQIASADAARDVRLSSGAALRIDGRAVAGARADRACGGRCRGTGHARRGRRPRDRQPHGISDARHAFGRGHGRHRSDRRALDAQPQLHRRGPQLPRRRSERDPGAAGPIGNGRRRAGRWRDGRQRRPGRAAVGGRCADRRHRWGRRGARCAAHGARPRQPFRRARPRHGPRRHRAGHRGRRRARLRPQRPRHPGCGQRDGRGAGERRCGAAQPRRPDAVPPRSGRPCQRGAFQPGGFEHRARRGRSRAERFRLGPAAPDDRARCARPDRDGRRRRRLSVERRGGAAERAPAGGKCVCAGSHDRCADVERRADA
jgi:hypothetical protein